MAAGISTRNRATLEKSSFVEVESMCGPTGYPLRTPGLEDTVLDAHNREPVTAITQRYLGVLRFCRWSKLGHHQKLALFISEIRVERSCYEPLERFIDIMEPRQDNGKQQRHLSP